MKTELLQLVRAVGEDIVGHYQKYGAEAEGINSSPSPSKSLTVSPIGHTQTVHWPTFLGYRADKTMMETGWGVGFGGR